MTNRGAAGFCLGVWLGFGWLFPVFADEVLENEVSEAEEPRHEETWMDGSQEWATDALYRRMVWLDSMFYSSDVSERDSPRSRFRVSVFNMTDLEDPSRPHPDVEFSASVRLPGLRDRFRLVLDSDDLQQYPDSGVEERSERPRVALRRVGRWLDADVGVRTNVPPILFVRSTMRWTGYTDPVEWNFSQRFFYETEEGFGEITSLSQHCWLADRWMLGHSTSARWTEQTVGLEWQDSFSLMWVTGLMEEDKHGRYLGTRDLSHGLGLRTQIRGGYNGTHTMNSYRVGMVYRCPMFRRDYLYLEILPEVTWAAEKDWEPEYTLRVGIDILFWYDR